ncbi:hypothetical protein MHY87_02825 [Microvirga sp. ACRRW]|uniref:hypothetical protein n=1 Tax=Microvirga sp. ACRRW TaxID=2918205 RepID=UPI001EF45EC1|nr:hypothetical protein [Microvirga sp. ACRRW]MCG7391838.1 hypothetical protein [Microvirga sp. ACRRW]
MCARSPEESSEEKVQTKILQAIHDALDDTQSPAEPQHKDVPVSQTPQEKLLDTKVELDRVELYLKGPTVFTA